MAGKYTGLQKTYVAEDVIAKNVGVTYGTSEGKCKVAGLNEVMLGVASNDEALVAGRDISIQLDGIPEIVASGGISYGDKLVFAASGKAKKLPAVAGTYNVIGYAEADAADGKILPFRMCPLVVVVS